MVSLGRQPQEKLPFLATYLGHRDIHSTLIYITVTQDLLQQASERFRINLGSVSPKNSKNVVQTRR